MNSEIELFKNEGLNIKVRTILNNDGSISINAEDAARGFGWIQKQNKNNKEYLSIRWETINNYCNELGFPNKLGKDDFIPESLFYMLGMKANNKTAVEFQKWLSVEVLPSIRKHGAYITQEVLADKEKLEDTIYQLQLDAKMIKEEKEVIQKENCKLRTERHMPSVVCIKAKTDESYLPDLALQLIRLYLKEHDNIITRKAEDGIYIKKKPIEKELKKITFTSKERTLLILSIGNIIENTNEIFIKNEYLADDFYLKSTEFLND